MSLSTTLGNVLSLDRQRARYESERVNGGEEEEQPNNNASPSNETTDVESGVATSAEEEAPVRHTEHSSSQEEGRRRRRRSSRISRSQRGRSSGALEQTNNTSETAQENEEEDSDLVDVAFGGADNNENPNQNNTEDDDATASSTDADAADRLFGGRNTMTLAELEEQRELSRRRTSACVLLAVFVLFRLWIECLQKKDPTLFLLCLLGTSWTARWVRYNREREEELDRRIENYLQNNNNNNNNEMDRNEFARMSFQAQLALAIMESQRHMMEGGYGRPDEEQASPGVSDEAKGRWKQFNWKEPSARPAAEAGKKGDYGALPTKMMDDNMDNHCSICLSEYEDKETLTQLPCGHVYHDECIQSWTNNHTKCPLCNLDLESVSHENDSIV